MELSEEKVGLTGRGLTEKLFVQTAKFMGISMKAKGRKIVDSPSLPRFNTSISDARLLRRYSDGF